jgi:hypothetical protein
MKTKRILSLFLCAAFIMITFTNKVNASSPAADIDTIEEDASSTPTIDPNNYTLDELNTYTETLISNKWGKDQFQFRGYEDCVVIDLWGDGIADFAEMAKTNAEYKDLWDSTVESMRDMSELFYGQYSNFDMDTYVYVLNDKNLDNVLIMTMDGVRIFDCVNDDEDTGVTIDMTRMRFR